jgi:hypothetical protein
VGGQLTVTDQHLEFKPNAANKALHGAASIQVDGVVVHLSDVQAVRVISAPITKIVEITSPALTLKVRCFGAKAIATHLEAATARD